MNELRGKIEDKVGVPGLADEILSSIRAAVTSIANPYVQRDGGYICSSSFDAFEDCRQRILEELK